MSNADKRTVATDALETLGMIHNKPEKRDAIHLAVIQVTANELLSPSDPISSVDGNAFYDRNGLGIVDPFLNGQVNEGQQFWMVIRPRIIHSLRHVWSHPAFDDELEVIDIKLVESNSDDLIGFPDNHHPEKGHGHAPEAA